MEEEVKTVKRMEGGRSRGWVMLDCPHIYWCETDISFHRGVDIPMNSGIDPLRQ